MMHLCPLQQRALAAMAAVQERIETSTYQAKAGLGLLPTGARLWHTLRPLRLSAPRFATTVTVFYRHGHGQKHRLPDYCWLEQAKTIAETLLAKERTNVEAEYHHGLNERSWPEAVAIEDQYGDPIDEYTAQTWIVASSRYHLCSLYSYSNVMRSLKEGPRVDMFVVAEEAKATIKNQAMAASLS